MPNYERGTYEPNDEIRIFDGSEDDEDPEGSRLPLLIVLSLLVLAMFAGVVWMAYSYGVVHGRTEPRVLAAESGPARVAPANPGGTQTPYKGFKIYEQPAPADDDADATPPVSAPVVAKKMAAPQKAVPPPPPLKKQAVATPVPKIAPHPIPAKKVAVAPAPKAAATAPPARLTPAAKPAPTKAAAPAASGAYVLQIGAYKSQADADAAWRTYKAKHAALLAGYGPDVQKADLGEKGTWYRLRIAGFPSKDVAGAMCDRLKSDGGNCFLGH